MRSYDSLCANDPGHLKADDLAQGQFIGSSREQAPCRGGRPDSLGRLGVFHAVAQLELMRLAAVQRGEAGQEVDELAGGGRGRARGLALVSPPGRRRTGRRHGVHHQGRPRGRVGEVSLAGRGRQRAMAGVQHGEECRMCLHCQPVHVAVGGRQALRAGAERLAVFGLDLGALGELETHPLAGLLRAGGRVLLPRLGRGPLDCPVLLGRATFWEGRKRKSSGSGGWGGEETKQQRAAEGCGQAAAIGSDRWRQTETAAWHRA